MFVEILGGHLLEVVASLNLLCVWGSVERHGKWRMTYLVQDPFVRAGRSSGPPLHVLHASPTYNFNSPPLPKPVLWHFTFSTCAKNAAIVSIVLLQDHPLDTDQFLTGQIYTYYTSPCNVTQRH